MNQRAWLAPPFAVVLRNLCFPEVTQDDGKRHLASLNRHRLSNARGLAAPRRAGVTVVEGPSAAKALDNCPPTRVRTAGQADDARFHTLMVAGPFVTSQINRLPFLFIFFASKKCQ